MGEVVEQQEVDPRQLLTVVGFPPAAVPAPRARPGVPGGMLPVATTPARSARRARRTPGGPSRRRGRSSQRWGLPRERDDPLVCAHMDAGLLQAGIIFDLPLDVLHDLVVLPLDRLSFRPRHHCQLIAYVPCALDGPGDLSGSLLLGLTVHLPAERDHAGLGRDVDVTAADPFVREQGQLGLEGEPGVRDLPRGGRAGVLDRALYGGHLAGGRPLGGEAGAREQPQTQPQHRNHRSPCHVCVSSLATVFKGKPVPALLRSPGGRSRSRTGRRAILDVFRDRSRCRSPAVRNDVRATDTLVP